VGTSVTKTVEGVVCGYLMGVPTQQVEPGLLEGINGVTPNTAFAKLLPLMA